MHIEHIRAMLSERHKVALEKAGAGYENKRIALYQYQGEFHESVMESETVKSFDKSLRIQLKALAKSCGIRNLSLSGRVDYSSSSCTPCPPHLDGYCDKPIVRVGVSVRYEARSEDADFMGRREGGELRFVKHIWMQFRGKTRELLEKWADGYKGCNTLEARSYELRQMNIENESQILHLKVTEPNWHSTIEQAITQLLR